MSAPYWRPKWISGFRGASWGTGRAQGIEIARICWNHVAATVAEGVVSAWPDDLGAALVNNVDLHETVRRAERIADD